MIKFVFLTCTTDFPSDFGIFFLKTNMVSGKLIMNDINLKSFQKIA